jgi:hypothetical protein
MPVECHRDNRWLWVVVPPFSIHSAVVFDWSQAVFKGCFCHQRIPFQCVVKSCDLRRQPKTCGKELEQNSPEEIPEAWRA